MRDARKNEDEERTRGWSRWIQKQTLRKENRKVGKTLLGES